MPFSKDWAVLETNGEILPVFLAQIIAQRLVSIAQRLVYFFTKIGFAQRLVFYCTKIGFFFKSYKSGLLQSCVGF